MSTDSQEQRQAAVIREFKARYHEMASQIAFLKSKIEACRPVLEELASYNAGEQACLASEAKTLLNNWPSDTLYHFFNQEDPHLQEDLEIGRKWRTNSALESWFPFTAAELDILRTKVVSLESALREKALDIKPKTI